MLQKNYKNATFNNHSEASNVIKSLKLNLSPLLASSRN